MRLTPDQVGEKIRAARLANGWTHEELARRMNANWRTVQRWQKGKLPRLQTLLRLADVLGVPHSYLIDDEDSVTSVADFRQALADLTARVESLTRAVAALEDGSEEKRESPLRQVVGSAS
jgi:transcriptional regulator with XRE-family HTH domain